VTGGAGFIGSHLVDELRCGGWEVAVVDDLSSSTREYVRGDASFHHRDVCELVDQRVREEVGSADAIFHLAAQSSVARSVRDPLDDALRNVIGTVCVLEAARAWGSRVVFASTGGAMYGECDRPAEEHDELRPAAPYGWSKRAAELYVLGYARLHRMPNLVLRYANVYGPRQRPDGEAGVVSILVDAATDGRTATIHGDGEQTRDFVHVWDVVRATVQAAEQDLRGVYNVGTGFETRILDLHRLVAEVTHDDPDSWLPLFGPERPGDLRRSVVSPGALCRDLGWAPLVSLDVGVELVYEWLLDRQATRA
jgi:UDP-glucose 4-epimerase